MCRVANAIHSRNRPSKYHGSLTAAISVAPRIWTERSYRNLIHFNELPKGGHFAAWEQPKLFVNELRVGFKSLR